MVSRIELCGLHCYLYKPGSVSYTYILPTFNIVLCFPVKVPAVQKGQAQGFKLFR